MIVFTLDALADDSHRRHLIDAPEDNCITCCRTLRYEKENTICTSCKIDTWNWKQDFPAYYEACDGDAPIKPVIEIINYLFRKKLHECKDHIPIEIWSNTYDSVRQKTEVWMYQNGIPLIKLKMRPIGDDRPQEELFEEWLIDLPSSLITGYVEGKNDLNEKLDFVFSSHGPTIDMFRARGVFVFDCNQGK